MQESILLLTFVGMPGAGKGTCTDFLETTYNLPIIHFGRMVYKEVKRRGLDIVKDEKMVREDMRAKEGVAVLAKRVAITAKEHIAKGQHVIVLDGLYSWSEYKYLQAEFGAQLVVIAVTAPKKLRHQRAIVRQDGQRTYTMEQLVSREIAEIENLEKGGPIAYADFTLDNSKDQDHLLTQLTGVLHELGVTKQ